MLAAFVMAGDPDALFRFQLVNECHIQLIQNRVNAAHQTAFALILGFGLDFYRFFLQRAGDHIIPQGHKTLFQLGRGKLAQILEGVKLQPQKQCFFRQNIIPDVQRFKGFQEVMVIGIEGPAFVFRPRIAHALADVAQQPGVVSGTAELHDIKFGFLVEFHEFIIGFDPGILARFGHNALYRAGDPGGTEVPQHTDALVALLDIKVAQIFITQNGIRNAGITQMGLAELDPLDAEFGFDIQKRPETGGKRSDPSGGFCADDPLRRNVHKTQVQHGFGGIFRQDLIQHGRMGALSGHDQIPVLLLSQTQGMGIFFQCGFRKHLQGSFPERDILSHII